MNATTQHVHLVIALDLVFRRSSHFHPTRISTQTPPEALKPTYFGEKTEENPANPYATPSDPPEHRALPLLPLPRRAKSKEILLYLNIRFLEKARSP